MGREELRLVTRHVLASLPHELACRLAKRHGFEETKGTHDWQLAEKARNLYRKCEAKDLARLIFEAILIGSAGNVSASKDDDLLRDAASLYKVDARAVRAVVAKAGKEKTQKKNKAANQKKTALKPKSDPK